MSKSKRPPDEPEKDDHQVSPAQIRWYWIRTILITVLMFVVIMWFAYPSRGNIAILWAAGLSVAVLGYFVFSYFKLYR